MDLLARAGPAVFASRRVRAILSQGVKPRSFSCKPSGESGVGE